MASFARLISTHSCISPFGFGTITTGLTHGVGPFTDSVISSFKSSSNLFSILLLKLIGGLLNACATGATLGSMCNDN